MVSELPQAQQNVLQHILKLSPAEIRNLPANVQQQIRQLRQRMIVRNR